MASWYDYDLKDYPAYSKDHYTAASRDYPRGTILYVCTADNMEPSYSPYNIECVEVRVNDYGPEAGQSPERAIDLSSKAFKDLRPLSRGLIPVTISVFKN